MDRLDLDFVRAQFPAFSEPALQNQSFLENAGGSFTCGPVIDRLTRFYRSRKVQPYAPYGAARAGGAEMDEARERLAAMLGVAADDVHFGPSTSQNTYVLAQAFRQMLKPGAAVVVTNQDHEANSGAWRRLAEAGIEIREWGINRETGLLEMAGLERLLDDRVRLVTFPHVSNVIGAINPVAEITARAREAGAIVCVDGVSFAPHGFPDVAALGPDIYLFSAYKTYGPHLGIMVLRRELAGRLPNQGHHFNAGSVTKRLTPAGPDHAQIAASAGMADYVDALHTHHFAAGPGPRDRARAVRGLFGAHEAALMAPLLEALRANNRVRLLGPAIPEGRVGTLALSCAEPGEALSARLCARGVNCWGGDFYAPRPLAALGLDPAHGVLRLSMVHYNSAEDISRVLNALDDVV